MARFRQQLSWLFISLWSFAQLAFAEPAPVFSQLTLEESLLGAQPSVVLERNHGFVVTWQSTEQGVASLKWIAFDFDGKRTDAGVIARGKNWFVNWADIPALAVLDNGDWVAFWLEKNDPLQLEGYDIRVVRSTDRGKTWSRPVTPHRDGTLTQHGFVSMVAAGDDRVLIAWLDGRRAAELQNHSAAHEAHNHDSAPMTLRSAVIDRADKILSEYQVDEQTCSCCQTDMVRWGELPALVYRDRTDREIRDIAISAYSTTGWTSPVRVHDDQWEIEGCPVNGPAIAVNGRFGMVFWPTVVDEKITLRYVLTDSPSALMSKPRMRQLDLPNLPSGRVDVVAWRQGFLLTWISRARDRPAVETAFVSTTGEVRYSGPLAEPALRGRATGFPRVASDGNRGLVVWPEANSAGEPAIGLALIR